MGTGTVKWVSDEKGFGFITPYEGGRDLFVHFSGIIGDGYRSLAEGAKVTYEVKGSLLRVAASKHGRTIVDTSTLRAYVVDDEKQTFAASQVAVLPGEPRMTRTGRKDRVAERECEIWQIDEPGTPRREACVLKGAALVDPASRSLRPWEKELAVRGLFPLRLVEGDRARLVVTRLDARPMPVASFAVPKSYRNLAAH